MYDNDLIRRKDALDAVYVLRGSELWGVAYNGIKVVEAVDAVCVVRCKECVYHATSYSEGCVYCNMLCRVVPEDGYCMYGERRESE